MYALLMESWRAKICVDARDISSQRKMRKPFVRQLAAAEISVIEVCNIGEKRVCNVAPRRNEAEGNLRRAAQSGRLQTEVQSESREEDLKHLVV